MTGNLTALLDKAITKQLDHAPLAEILSEYSQESGTLRPLLETAALFETLQPVVFPDDATLAADRDIFLTHLGNMQPVAVSPAARIRIKKWITQHVPIKPTILHQKKLRPMGALIIVALIFSMIFGAVGVTAALSNSSLPNSPLYPLKLTIEEARLAFTGNPSAKAALHLAFAQERAEEIAQVAQAGEVPNQFVQDQLQFHWQNALHLMVQAPETAMLDLLVQAEEIIENQERKTEEALAGATGAVYEVLAWQSGYLAQIREVIAIALQDPQAFRRRQSDLIRHTYGENDPSGSQYNQPNGPNGAGNGEPTGPGLGGFGPGPSGPFDSDEGSCEDGNDCKGEGMGDRLGPRRDEPASLEHKEPQGPGSRNPESPGDGPGPGEPNGPGIDEPREPDPGGSDGSNVGGSNGPHPGQPSRPGIDDSQVPGSTDSIGPGNSDGNGSELSEPRGSGNDDPLGPGPDNSHDPGDGDGNSPGSGDPSGPGNDDPQGPGPDDPNDPGDSDGNRPGPSESGGSGNDDPQEAGPGDPTDPGDSSCKNSSGCNANNNDSSNVQNGNENGQNSSDDDIVNDQNGTSTGRGSGGRKG
ncbi:MAG: hypothetical protein GWP61_17925 [Chloroflexi bacterium]|nr:hypothetical protein [Chloroflexota bacterium]